MSYSFIVRADNKESAKACVTAELAKVVATQSVHAADRDQAEAAAFAFIDLLADDDTKSVQVNVHGSLGWFGGADSSLTNASVGVSVSLTDKQQQAAA